MAAELVKKVLWRGEGAVEDAEEWIDVVQYHLGGDLSVLFREGGNDGDGCSDSILWCLLRVE